jgi:hypothetical protein
LAKGKENGWTDGRIEIDFIQRNLRVDVLDKALETFANVCLALLEAGARRD